MKAEIWAEPAWKPRSDSKSVFVDVARFLQSSVLDQESGPGTARDLLVPELLHLRGALSPTPGSLVTCGRSTVLMS